MPQPKQQTPSSPLPNLSVQTGSGLNFPWAEYHRGVAGTAESILGADGVTQGMVIWMNWQDIVATAIAPPTPLCQLIGYSKRVFIPGTSPTSYGLSRVIPWQSPYFNQLYVKRISSVRGVQMGGKVFNFLPGYSPGNIQLPAIDFKLGLVALEFWRPPYFVLPDSEVPRDGNGYPTEWVRYLDKRWEMSDQMLARQGQQFVWLDGSDAGGSQLGVPGAPGQPLVKLHLKRRWYEIPEQAVFSKLTDGTPNGIPTALLYTHTKVVNPVSCFTANPFVYPNGGAGTTTGYPLAVGSPLVGCVNAPTSAAGGQTTAEIFDSTDAANLSPPITVAYNRFLGFPMGTLLYMGSEIIPRPLQLPAWMMEIPFINASEPASQQQYDIVFNFLYFDPPTNQARSSGINEPFRGHNLMPFSGTGLWKMVRTQTDSSGTANSTAGPFRTPLDYANFTDLFRVVQD